MATTTEQRLAERLQTVLGRDAFDFFSNSLKATAELVVLACRAHVVQYRKEVLQHTLDRHLPREIAIAVDPALVVNVLGLQPL